jgi:PTH1 family peptidyl-tRNA hydrolase
VLAVFGSLVTNNHLIVGLGNPGPEYCFTRHNFGFMLLDRLVAKAGESDFRYHSGVRAEIAEIGLDGKRILLVKPQTFMNCSGESLAAVFPDTGIAVKNLLVVHDDLDLALGRIKLKIGGGSGGHRGVESIAAGLGIHDFPRLRLGIGRPPSRGDTVAYVLSSFTPEEMTLGDGGLERAVEGLELWLRDGPVAAMNQLNRSPEPAGLPE